MMGRSTDTTKCYRRHLRAHSSTCRRVFLRVDLRGQGHLMLLHYTLGIYRFLSVRVSTA
jgi:hypothetical protein